MKTIGEMIRTARDAKLLTLRALAAKLGMSVGFLCDLEHDRRQLPAGRLADLARELDLPVSDLEAASGRLASDVTEYIRENPTLAALLRELMQQELGERELSLVLDYARQLPRETGPKRKVSR